MAEKSSKQDEKNTYIQANSSRINSSLPVSKKSAILKTKMKNPKLRVGLPTIDSFEKHIVMGVEGPGKVVIRLERLMGSNRVPLNDAKYIDRLTEKIDEEEQILWEKRKLRREKGEKDRVRQLAINGMMEPDEDMKDLENHPVFRVNKILDRLAKIDDSMNIKATTQTPKLKLIEPFHENEYVKDGILFGFHKNHYRREQLPVLKQGEEKEREDKNVQVSLFYDADKRKLSEEIELLERKRSESELADKPKLSAEDEELEDNEEEQTETDEDNEIEEEEWGGEGYSDPDLGLNPKNKIKNGKSLEESGSNTTIRRESLAHVTGDFGVKENVDLEKKWAARKAPWIEKLFDPAHRDADSMYKYANSLLDSYKREKLAADNLAGKYLRRISG